MQGNDSFKKYMIYNEETEEYEDSDYYTDSHSSEYEMFYDEELAENISMATACEPEDMEDDEKEAYKLLLKLLSKSKPAETYALKHHKELIENKTDRIMVFPNNYAGLSLITVKDKSSSKEIYEVFPFFSEGREYNCRIKSLLFNDDENSYKEGQIEAFIDEEENLLLTFYDIHFLDNHFLYNPNDTFKFIIMGLAREIEIIENEDLISLNPAYDKLSEEYDINTVVRKVKLLDNEINGEKVWKMTIVIDFTPEGEDILLDIYATSRSFEDSTIPQEGDNISARLSLHGYLTGIEK